MERSSTLFKHLSTSHLSTAQTSADKNLDTLGTSSHCRCNGHLNSSSVRYTALNLAGNAVCNNVSINLRSLNLKDVNLNILVGNLIKLNLQLIYLLTALTNDKTRLCSVDSYGYKLKSSLNDNLRDVSFGKSCVQILTNLVILKNLSGVICSAIPVGIPSADNSKSVANWIGFLSHIISPPLLVPPSRQALLISYPVLWLRG